MQYDNEKSLKYRRALYYVLSLTKLYQGIKFSSFPNFTKSLVTKDPKIVRLKNGLTFRLLTLLDVLTLKEVVIDDEYQANGVKISEKDKVIVDIGAGFGDFSILIARKFPKSEIHAFEPDLRYFKLIKENNKSNNIKNVFAYSKPIYSLKEIFNTISADKIDFLKMDCEGCEFAILKDSNKNNYIKKIGKISMEYHENGLKKAINLKNTLSKAGFRVNIFPRKNVSGLGLLFAIRK